MSLDLLTASYQSGINVSLVGRGGDILLIVKVPGTVEKSSLETEDTGALQR